MRIGQKFSWTFHYSIDFENSDAKRIDIDVDKEMLPSTDISILVEEQVSYIDEIEITVGHMITDQNPETTNLYYPEFINVITVSNRCDTCGYIYSDILSIAFAFMLH